MTNWYSIFYWLTVADSAKQVLNVIWVIALIAGCISLIGYFVSTHSKSEASVSGEESYQEKEWTVWVKAWKTTFTILSIVWFITIFLWIFIPTKKDALIIIAGGAVGNFVTQDSSARKIPSEVMLLLRTKIKEEITETNLKEAVGLPTDTLRDKSKEELIELLKEKEKK